MCLQSKKIIKSKDVIFMKDRTSNRNELEMRPSEKNKGPPMVVVNEYSKSCSCDNGEERKKDEKQVGYHMIANEEAIEILVENDSNVESFGKDEKSLKKRYFPREWWKNHIVPQHREKWANVTFLEDDLNFCKALRYENASKWEAPMQEV